MTVETVTPAGPGVYRAESNSRDGGEYTIQVHGGEADCNCPGFQSHGHCWHVGAAREQERERGGTTTALAPIRVQPPTSILPNRDEINVIGTLAKSVIQAPGYAVPKDLDHPAKAFAVLLAGWELGVKPMTALRHVFVVNGRTEPDAQLLMGLVTAGDPTARFDFDERTAEKCVVTLHRTGRSPIRSEYTIKDAEKSGQTRKRGQYDGPWQLYPRDMLTWAAVKRACRLGAPDLINQVTPYSVGQAADLMTEYDTPYEALPESAPVQQDPEQHVDQETGEITEQVERPAEPAGKLPKGFDQEPCSWDGCRQNISKLEWIDKSVERFGAVFCPAHFQSKELESE